MRKINTARSFILLWLISSVAFARDADLHFWPMPIAVSDPMNSGALFAWPDFKVILQTKNKTSYAPAIIGDSLAAQLSRWFAPDEGSPIKIYDDRGTLSWGLTIPGGGLLSQENLMLLPFMTKKFVACLSTLNESELSLMKDVIYAPLSMINPDGSVRLLDSHKEIAASMFQNFQIDRCEGGAAAIPERLYKKVHQFVSVLLSGARNYEEPSSPAQLVFTTLFREFLFSHNGLWVRATLDMLHDFIEARLTLAPAIKDERFFDGDYESFLDFVLLSKDTSGLTKDHYLNIAKAFNITWIGDVFKPFPMKQYIIKGRIVITTIQIGTRQSTLFSEGIKE